MYFPGYRDEYPRTQRRRSPRTSCVPVRIGLEIASKATKASTCPGFTRDFTKYSVKVKTLSGGSLRGRFDMSQTSPRNDFPAGRGRDGDHASGEFSLSARPEIGKKTLAAEGGACVEWKPRKDKGFELVPLSAVTARVQSHYAP
jgi:hypothetical protein